MSRPDTEGFSIMDVSTHVLDDPKFLRLAIARPELYADCVVGFIATLARSWSKGRRVAAVEAWPAYRPANPDAIDALIEFRLLDRNGRLPAAWWRAEVVPFLRRRITRRRRLTLLRGFDREAV
ncbi:MAG TPA: hypothetical protein VFI40_11250, partial [Nocardioides sp.]|nr:hypothetical protein [Nocardioides sp.]